MHHGQFRDPSLVTVYDAQYGRTPDDDFFRSKVAEEPATRVLDLGCGTGRLALLLAADGYRVTGVEPERSSLDAARRKPGADAVTWIEGSTGVLPDAAFDAAVLTSHVAQFFVTDEAWAAAVADLRRALVPGGRLIFDSRDPADARWLKWTEALTRSTVTLPDGGTVDTWTEAEPPVDGRVFIRHHYAFSNGDRREATLTLRFRTEAQLRSSLAGFTVDIVHRPDGELLVTARRD